MGKGGNFVRTPKLNLSNIHGEQQEIDRTYLQPISPLVWGEIALGIYALADRNCAGWYYRLGYYPLDVDLHGRLLLHCRFEFDPAYPQLGWKNNKILCRFGLRHDPRVLKYSRVSFTLPFTFYRSTGLFFASQVFLVKPQRYLFCRTLYFSWIL